VLLFAEADKVKLLRVALVSTKYRDGNRKTHQAVAVAVAELGVKRRLGLRRFLLDETLSSDLHHILVFEYAAGSVHRERVGEVPAKRSN
jgi:hypothetical protein